jgi:deoxyribodipyrimidine photolyase-related protein
MGILAGMRNLILILGDQLDLDSAVFDDFDTQHDAVWMAEVVEESTHVWSHQARIALFLSAMRHFANAQSRIGRQVLYRRLDDPQPAPTLADALHADLLIHHPQRLIAVLAGDWRVAQALEKTAIEAGLILELREDRHFYTSPADFQRWAHGKRELRLEFWYRQLRQRFGVLMDGAKPVGGQWNFDADNRGNFARGGPGPIPAPRQFAPDAITVDVLRMVAMRFAEHPGDLASFDWPVTADQAQQALDDFIEQRLPLFGQYQDAMWTQQPWLYHSRLSAAMNLKLLAPQRVVAAALQALAAGHAPLAAVEGFVRQILGWREYVRGLYWLRMPGYVDDNALDAQQALPEFYWTGETDYACLRDTLAQTLKYGYAHHIQRLMVTGLFALLLGVKPRAVHQWYLAIYIDAVEWVELPNTLGMSQYADGGVMASKPYVASGKYIQRMSNYCAGCQFDPSLSTGPKACPFTTLYWDFLLRHSERFAKHPRTALMWRNAERLDSEQRTAIMAQAQQLRLQLAASAADADAVTI